MTRLANQAGVTMMEYVLILIVLGLAILFVMRNLGSSLRARYGAVKATTNVTIIDPNRHVEVQDNGLSGTAKSVPNQ
jgi:Flp pilus assembly pilin Flp